MKAGKFYTLLLLLAPLNIFATVRTVSNNPATLAQFNDIQLAINASASGDTVYVHGSPNTYALFTITNKQLVVIGPGWAPNKNFPFTASVSGITITGAASANTEIHGLKVTSTISINSNKPDNIKFIRNHFESIGISINQGGVTYSGYLFENNLFDNSGMNGAGGSTTYSNFLFQNNYFFNGSFNSFSNTTSSFLINHNLFFGPTSAFVGGVFNGCQFLTITNNIFVKRDAGSSLSNSTFNNNITFFPGIATPPTSALTPWAVNGNANSGGNVSNTDPQMVAQTAVNTGTNNPLNDFTIAAGPADNTGSDGKDIGLLYDAVGSLNFTNARNSRLPRIVSMNVTTPTVPAGGNVTVNVNASISN